MKRRWMALLLLLTLLTPALAQAGQASYRGYTYNTWKESVSAPNLFLPERALLGKDMGTTPLRNPQDLFVGADGHLFIADTGNNRVVELDAEYQLVRIWDTFENAAGEETLSAPTGVFVRENGDMYIADGGNQRVLSCDKDGRVLRLYGVFRSDLLPEQFNYQPDKVMVDRSDIVYVLSKGNYQGMLTFDQNGTFLGFYGSNNVSVTLSVIVDRIWKRVIMTDAQRLASVRTIPTAYNNLFLDADGFIYTTVGRDVEDTSMNEIRKLNPKGSNVFPEWDYGDLESITVGGILQDTIFQDVAVRDDIVFGLDGQRNRVFVYDQEEYMLGAFGGAGNNLGSTTTASAIELMGENVVVLDGATGSLNIYAPTEYGRLVIEGMILYNDGRYQESTEIWEQVLHMNANNEIAFMGLGRAQLKLEQSEAAMASFRKADNQKLYSDAFRDYRKDWIRDNFGYLMAGLALLLGLWIWRRQVNKKRRLAGYVPSPRGAVRQALYTARHPVKGYEEIKYEGAGSVWVGLGILIAFFVSAVLMEQYSAFTFNMTRDDEYNVLYTLASSLAPACVFVIVNWAVCTLMSGEGSMRQIWIAVTYALLPLVLYNLLFTGASYLIVVEEYVFFNMLYVVSMGYMVIMVFQGLRIMHQYSSGKTIVSILITLLGLLVVVFILVLLYSLFEEIMLFFRTIYNELLFRYS